MLPLWALMAAGGAGLGALKSELIDKPNEEKDRIMQAAVMRYSPWTGMKPKDVARTDTLGTTLASGITGAQAGGDIQKSVNDSDLSQAIASRLGGPQQVAQQQGPAPGASKIQTPQERSALPMGDFPSGSSDSMGLQQIMDLLKARDAQRKLFT